MTGPDRDLQDGATLPQFLLERARHTSDRQLALDAALGLAVAAAAVIFRPPFWIPFTALAFCLGAFGVWGILDRELGDADPATRKARLIQASRGVVGALGAVVAVLFALTVLFSVLGTWIS